MTLRSPLREVVAEEEEEDEQKNKKNKTKNQKNKKQKKQKQKHKKTNTKTKTKTKTTTRRRIGFSDTRGAAGQWRAMVLNHAKIRQRMADVCMSKHTTTRLTRERTTHAAEIWIARVVVRRRW